MPQMSNLWWLTLMLTTSLSFILGMILVYHSSSIQHKMKHSSLKKTLNKWSW